MEYKKCRQSAKIVISSTEEKKQKECASDLNDPEHHHTPQNSRTFDAGKSFKRDVRFWTYCSRFSA